MENLDLVDPSLLETVHRRTVDMTAKFNKRKSWEMAGTDALTVMLITLVQVLTPNADHKKKRESLTAIINRLVQSGLNYNTGMHVLPYGSFVSELYTPTGDVDLAIEGSMRPQNEPDAISVDLSRLEKGEKARLLRGLVRRLTKGQMVEGEIITILHARVPIIKFTERSTGVACDVSVASGHGRFKSQVLGYLVRIDRRFSQLVRVLKKWATLNEVNNATMGTFNTFALTNLIVFHLQQRKPAILPPLYRLWEDSPEALRPLQRPNHSSEQSLKACEQAVQGLVRDKFGAGNTETLLDLLVSFFIFFHTALSAWSKGLDG
eukprot:jgi/Botrbrau1/19130/Bobra.0077s0042.1